MVPPKAWVVINFSLGLVIVLLLLNLLGINLPSLGQVQYVLDREPPLCLAYWQGHYESWTDLDSCCLEAYKQLNCFFHQQNLEQGRVDWVCRTGESSVSYGLNAKAYRYCQQQSYWR